MSPRSTRRRRYGGALATAAAAIVVVGGAIGVRVETQSGGGGETGYTANIFVSTTGGTTTCVRSAADITFTAADAADNVCNSWWRACLAATATDNVGVKAGTFASYAGSEPFIPTGADGFGHNCSDVTGASNDYNPNWAEQAVAEGSTANWVTFECADGQTPETVKFGNGDFWLYENARAIVRGGCFYLPSVAGSYAGAAARVPQNIWLEGLSPTQRIRIDALVIYGGRNIRMKHWESGPHTICGQAGNPNVLDQYECNPNNTTTTEAFWASRGPDNVGDAGGSSQIAGAQPPDIEQSAPYPSINIRSEEHYVHDYQTKNANAPNEWHTGCGQIQFQRGTGPDGLNADLAHNIVIDKMLCERVSIQGFFLELASGVTIQNSVFGCNTHHLTENLGWSDCADSGDTFPEQAGMQLKGGSCFSGVNCIQGSCAAPYTGCVMFVPTNILFRYNSMGGPMDMGQYPSTTNVKALGNISKGSRGCDSSLTWDRNVWYDPTPGDTNPNCGTNFVNQNGARPWIQPNHVAYPYPPTQAQIDTQTIDFHLGTGPYTFENSIVELTGDYALAKDYDSATRTSGSRDPGIDER